MKLLYDHIVTVNIASIEVGNKLTVNHITKDPNLISY